MKSITIALSSIVLGTALAMTSFTSHASQDNPLDIAAPFKYAKQVVNQESMDMLAKKQRIQDYVDDMDQQHFTRMVKAVGTERFISKQAIIIGKTRGVSKANQPVLRQQQRLDNALQSVAASKQMKRVLAQYLYADASKPVYAGLSEGMLATRMPTPSN